MSDDLRTQLQTTLGAAYTLDRELGGGGMSRVFVARETALGREVVVKVLAPDLAAGVSAERFAREIATAARLQQANIVPVLTAGASAGLPYYTMPFVKGESLRALMSNGTSLPMADRIHVLRDVARALAYAHAEGVIHRDIKPDNILLSGGTAVVTDFGIAKAISAARTQDVHASRSDDGTLTQVGSSIGTPAYMAPEQAVGESVTTAADIYSWGVVAYELLAGAHPFAGRTGTSQLIAAHIAETPRPLSALNTEVPPDIVTLVMQTLAKNPQDRPENAGVLLARLNTVVTPGAERSVENRASAVAVTQAPSRRRLLTMAGVGITAVAFAAAWWVQNRQPATAVLASSEQLTRLAGMEESPVIAPDGKSVAYLAFGPSDSSAHVEFRRTDGGDAVQIAGALRPTAWSPSGDKLLVSGPQGLEVRPALGGQGTVIDSRASFGCWSPDGKQIAYFVADSLFISGENHETPRLVTRAENPHSPVWSPDGKWIAFVSGNSEYFKNYNIASTRVLVVKPEGGAPVPVTAADAINMSPTWAPDSHRLLMVSSLGGVRDVYQVNLKSDGTPKGKPIRISTGLNPSLIALSADGNQLAYSVATYQTNVWKARAKHDGWISTRGALLVTNDHQTTENIEVSRDGKWLVFDSDRKGVMQIFRMPVVGGAVQQLTNGSDPSFKPVISPDGSEVAYHTIVDGLRRIFVVGVNGGKPVQISPGTAPDERNASWSPDGNHLAWVVQNPYVSVSRWVNHTIQVATRTGNGRWSKPLNVGFKGVLLTAAWADHGTALIGVDSSLSYVAQPIAGGEARKISARVTDDLLPSANGSGVLSSDGSTTYFLNYTSMRSASIVGLRMKDGHVGEVLRFDEPARPHSTSSIGIAEYNGLIYFTLSDLESDIWVARVTGLNR
jgi:Tol biopolymer transport system component/tRNA A-37 threonylcarbamoyl transferase component Bud32